jgi:hypothetical protein
MRRLRIVVPEDMPHFAPVLPAFVSLEILGAWEGNGRDSVKKRIARGHIPKQFVLHPIPGGPPVIDLQPYLGWLREQARAVRQAEQSGEARG